MDNFQTKELLMAKTILLLILLCAGIFLLLGGATWGNFGGRGHNYMSGDHQNYSDNLRPGR
jgi:hypothetical protein